MESRQPIKRWKKKKMLGTDWLIFMELRTNVTPSESAFSEIKMAAARSCALR
jgi:hypothetical protein